MKCRFVLAKMAAFLAALSFAALVSAQTELPVVIAYDAPPECASLEAFQKLLEAEIARAPNPSRPWRFSVKVRREGDTYVGMLSTETGVREVTAARCDDVLSAFAVIVAVADASDVSPPSPAPAPPVPAVSPPLPVVARLAPPAETHAPPPHAVEWRLGVRPFLWSHGPDADYLGPILGTLGVVSLEVPGGFSKMMFELGVGAAWSLGVSSPDDASPATFPYGSVDLTARINYLVLDSQACLVDLAVGQTGLSVLGCLRLGFATYISELQTGGAWWTGPGVRLRWQSPFSLFLEAGAALVAGTTTAGAANAPTWAEGALGLGFQL